MVMYVSSKAQLKGDINLRTNSIQSNIFKAFQKKLVTKFIEAYSLCTMDIHLRVAEMFNLIMS